MTASMAARDVADWLRQSWRLLSRRALTARCGAGWAACTSLDAARKAVDCETIASHQNPVGQAPLEQ